MKTPKSKNKFIGGEHRTTLSPFCSHVGKDEEKMRPESDFRWLWSLLRVFLSALTMLTHKKPVALISKSCPKTEAELDKLSFN